MVSKRSVKRRESLTLNLFTDSVTRNLPDGMTSSLRDNFRFTPEVESRGSGSVALLSLTKSSTRDSSALDLLMESQDITTK